MRQSADEIRTEAERVLDDPKYDRDGPGLIDELLGWIGDRIDDSLGRFLSAGFGDNLGLGYLALALLAVAIGYLLWRHWPSGLARRRRRVPTATVEVTSRRRRDEWLAEAETAAAEGRWADAVHARYRATSAGLADRGEVPEEEGLTALESLAAFDGEEGRRSALDAEVSRFRDVRYGGSTAVADDDAELRRLDARVLATGARRSTDAGGARPVADEAGGSDG